MESCCGLGIVLGAGASSRGRMGWMAGERLGLYKQQPRWVGVDCPLPCCSKPPLRDRQARTQRRQARRPHALEPQARRPFNVIAPSAHGWPIVVRLGVRPRYPVSTPVQAPHHAPRTSHLAPRTSPLMHIHHVHIRYLDGCVRCPRQPR